VGLSFLKIEYLRRNLGPQDEMLANLVQVKTIFHRLKPSRGYAAISQVFRATRQASFAPLTESQPEAALQSKSREHCPISDLVGRQPRTYWRFDIDIVKK
jgi:hypothetical protein